VILEQPLYCELLKYFTQPETSKYSLGFQGVINTVVATVKGYYETVT
jgi:hypothetical protein